MYNLEKIRKKVEDMLAESLNFSNVDAMRGYINEVFIIDYEEVLKQTIFEIYYENYKNHSESSSIANMFKDKESWELGSCIVHTIGRP